MGGKSNPSMNKVVLLVSFVVTLSHIPILFVDSPQGYKEQGLILWIDNHIFSNVTVRVQNDLGGR